MTIQNSDKSLSEFRGLIDAIDTEILESINQRLKIAKEIGAIKIRKGAQVIDPERESALIERLIALNKGPLSKENLYHIFKEIITISRQIQTPKLDDYIGPGATAVYAVIGDPVSHSLSPVMHNRAFAHTGYNGVYIALRVRDIAAAANGFRALDFKGISVTIPHKEAVLEKLTQADGAVRGIAAANTVIFEGGGVVRCLNAEGCAGWSRKDIDTKEALAKKSTNSSNSSKPPSSDIVDPQPPRKKKKKRKIGGQK